MSQSEAIHLGLGKRDELEKHIRSYRNGRDLGRSRGVMVIDLFGSSAGEVRRAYPEEYQHVKAEVKEKIVINNKGEKQMVGRDWNNRESYKENWWLFGEPRSDMRPSVACPTWTRRLNERRQQVHSPSSCVRIGGGRSVWLRPAKERNATPARRDKVGARPRNCTRRRSSHQINARLAAEDRPF